MPKCSGCSRLERCGVVYGHVECSKTSYFCNFRKKQISGSSFGQHFRQQCLVSFFGGLFLYFWRHFLAALFGSTFWQHFFAVLFGSTFWQHFTATLWGRTFGHFSAALFGSTFWQHISATLFGSTFRQHFSAALFGSTFWQQLLAAKWGSTLCSCLACSWNPAISAYLYRVLIEKDHQ